jgi:hypothetical protein
VRRSRTEHLFLVPTDGSRVELGAQSRDPGNLTTQDIFQVSPDGAFLAYAIDHTLHVRAADGSERTLDDYARLMRFSPDSKSLAAVLGERVVVFDLATGKTRDLAQLTNVTQLEWMRDGLVASRYGNTNSLVELPLAGERKTLHEAAWIERFVVAPTGTRVVVFDRDQAGSHVIAFDAATPTDTHELRVVSDPVTNAALSLDGQRLAFATSLALFTATGDARPEAVSDRNDIQSLWFAHDGRLGYASPTSATILDHGRAHRFDTEGPILMLRFDPLTQRALVATSTHAWDAMGSGRVAQEPELLGVDHFAGGLVLWTGHTTTSHSW